MRHSKLCAFLAVVLLQIASNTPSARSQVLPDGLGERFDTAGEPGDIVAASTPDGHVLLGTPRAAGLNAARFRAFVFGPDGEPVSDFTLSSEAAPAATVDQELAERTGPTSGQFDVAGRANGEFFVAWQRTEPDGSSSSIVARQFDRQGVATSNEILLEGSATGLKVQPSAVCNRTGRCAVAWLRLQPIPGHSSVLEGQILDALSPPTHERFVIAPSGSVGSYALALADDGRVGVAYTDVIRLGPSQPHDVSYRVSPRSRVFDALGNPLAGQQLDEEVASTDSAPRPTFVTAAFNGSGELLTAWDGHADGNGRSRIRAQRLDIFGALVGPITPLDDGLVNASRPALVWDAASERFAAVWLSSSARDDGSILLSNVLRLLAADGSPIGEELIAAAKLFHRFGHLLEHPSVAIGNNSSIHLAWLSTPNFGFTPPSSAERVAFRQGLPPCDPLEPSGRATCADVGPAGRFRVRAAYRASNALSKTATLETITPNAAFLYFQGQQNPEVVTKVLDGRTINDHLWYFSGAMSNQEYAVSVYDQQTGRTRVYFNPQDDLRSLADTGTFNDDDLATRSAAEAVAPALLSRGEAVGQEFNRAVGKAAPTLIPRGTGCSGATPTSLCLNQNRFRVEIDWRDFTGNTGTARAVQTTTDGGYFTFFNPNNVEVALKILDGRAINGKFWVFYASLSNVRFTVRIFDANGSLVKTYVNPRDTLQSVADTAAF